MQISVLQITLIISISAVSISAASLYICWKLRSKLKQAHNRLHCLERNQYRLEGSLAVVSHATTRAVAAHLKKQDVETIRCSSQHGEELFVWNLLGWTPEGVFVEIGAYDGVSLSNSLFFDSIGWKTILIEAHPDLAERCRINRPRAETVHAAVGDVNGGTVRFSMVKGAQGLDTLSFVNSSEQHVRRIHSQGGKFEHVDVPARTLRSILEQLSVSAVDCISIDVEGAELAVLHASSLEICKPKVIIVEDNSAGTDQSIPEFLLTHGYSLAATIGCNNIYVAQESGSG